MKTRISIALLFITLPFLAPAKEHVSKSIYDFKVSALNGSTIDFSAFKGKKILIVNTTAIAANNPQYAELEAMYKKYKDKLVIVGFLTQDFATPPGSKRNTTNLNPVNYKVTFPLASIVNVRDPDQEAPVYKWLTESQYNKFKDTEIKWDFQKYLINEQGALVAEFDPKIRVTDPRIIQAVEK